MKANVGGIDKVLRIVAGIAVLSLWFVLDAPAKYWARVGFVPLLTGLLNFCPLYTAIGLNTCPVKSA
jgi:hypothetical protein